MTSSRRRLAASLGTAAVVAVAFAGFLPRVADLGDAWGVVRGLSPGWVAALAGLALLNLATYPWLSMASLPGLRFWPALVVTQTSTAVANTVPAGAGVGVGVTYAMYGRYRFDRTAIALSITTTGIANTAVRFAMPLVAAGWLAIAGDAPGWAWHAALIGAAATVVCAVAVWVAVTRPTLVRWAEQRLGPIRRDARALSGRRGWLIVATAVVSHAALYALFLASVTATGAGIALATAFAAFATVRLGLSVPVTPGGVGIAEAGYAAALTGVGVPGAQAVAAVLLFRAASYLLPIPLGLACWLGATRTRRKARTDRAVPPCREAVPEATVESVRRVSVPRGPGGGDVR